MARGITEVFSIAGSMLGLSALSPMISRPFVRPVLKAFGINNDNKPDKKISPPNNSVKKFVTIFKKLHKNGKKKFVPH